MEQVKASMNVKDFPNSKQFWATRDQKMLDIFNQIQADGIMLENNYEYEGERNPQRVNYISYRYPQYYAKVVLQQVGDFRLTLIISLENHMTDSIFHFSTQCQMRVVKNFGIGYKYQGDLKNFFTEDAEAFGHHHEYLNSFLADIDEMYNLVKWSMERVKAFKFDGFEYDCGEQYAMFTAE